MTCRCGNTATVRLIVALPSRRGIGHRIEAPQCTRCADRSAWTALADGARRVEGRRI